MGVKTPPPLSSRMRGPIFSLSCRASPYTTTPRPMILVQPGRQPPSTTLQAIKCGATVHPNKKFRITPWVANSVLG